MSALATATGGEGSRRPSPERLEQPQAKYLLFGSWVVLLQGALIMLFLPILVFTTREDIPPAEMESLLLKSYGVDDEALRALANGRSENVKEWFTGKGGIASERMFIVAPKLAADGIQDKGPPTRVDFAIR